MQFKHPEILWALLLLLIPIFIHLFQLRKFKKTAFTNVAVLQTIKQNTRKSSQLKKWLLLLTRLGLFTALILAFAQPFIPNSDRFNKSMELVIYLDNSFSMQIQGVNGNLLNEAKQTLLNYLPENERFTLFTNNETYRNATRESIQRDLIGIDVSNSSLPFEAAYLKGLQYFSDTEESIKNFVMISDFQSPKTSWVPNVTSKINLGLIQLQPKGLTNIAIDSVYMEALSNNTKELTVKLSNYGDPVQEVSVSLYNKNELRSKAAANLEEDGLVTFSIADEAFEGQLQIEDNGLDYDNQYYFSINKSEKINVLGINNDVDGFLRKIYTEDEFIYTAFDVNSIEYNRFEVLNLIILNHLDNIPQALINALVDFNLKGGSILIIPSSQANIESYNRLAAQLKQPLYRPLVTSERFITDISVKHPLVAEAFYSNVTNFQYPKTSSYFPRSSNANAIYAFEDGASFFSGLNGIYSFSSALESTNSNFKNSPLIVPALYNVALQSLSMPKLSYTVGATNSITIKRSLESDQVLKLSKADYVNIPRQRSFGKYVEMTTGEEPSQDGIYDLVYKDDVIQKISFNYPRSESNLQYLSFAENDGLNLWSDFSEAISDIKSVTNVRVLWKWFVTFALLFLLLEMLILKFFK